MRERNLSLPSETGAPSVGKSGRIPSWRGGTGIDHSHMILMYVLLGRIVNDVRVDGQNAMVFLRFTAPIDRADLIRDCLREIRLWPGCETVEAIGASGDDPRRKFTLHVLDYGLARKHLADRALRCIEREKQRRYHLRTE